LRSPWADSHSYESVSFVHPLSAVPPARLPSAIQVLPVCAPPSSATLLVWHWQREHPPDPLHPLPAHAGAACLHVPLSGDAQHAVPAGPPHTTRRNHARYDGVVPPARPAGAQLPMQKAGSSSEDQGRRVGGEAETKASDGQGLMRRDQLRVRKWQRVPGRQADHLCLRRVFQGGCVPGATDGSMPVGSVDYFLTFLVLLEHRCFCVDVPFLRCLPCLRLLTPSLQ